MTTVEKLLIVISGHDDKEIKLLLDDLTIDLTDDNKNTILSTVFQKNNNIDILCILHMLCQKHISLSYIGSYYCDNFIKLVNLGSYSKIETLLMNKYTSTRAGKLAGQILKAIKYNDVELLINFDLHKDQNDDILTEYIFNKVLTTDRDLVKIASFTDIPLSLFQQCVDRIKNINVRSTKIGRTPNLLFMKYNEPEFVKIIINRPEFNPYLTIDVKILINITCNIIEYIDIIHKNNIQDSVVKTVEMLMKYAIPCSIIHNDIICVMYGKAGYIKWDYSHQQLSLNNKFLLACANGAINNVKTMAKSKYRR